jgi:hypothetical protein
MIVTTIAIDYFLHRWQLVYVGRYLGLTGTVLVIASFMYSLRKRKLITYGSPKKWLVFHEYAAWLGSVLLLVHAGIHFNALLPWLAILMLLVSVATGLVGKFVLKRARETLAEKKAHLLKTGMTKEAVEKQVFFDSVTVDIMKKWRSGHLPITFILAVLSLLHILTVIMLSK